MDCVICKNKAYIVLEKIDGYIQGSKYDIHECPICKTSFSDPLKSDPFVYNSIYKNPEKIIGYNRYLKYKNNVKSKPFPLEYLASKEAVYWSIQKFLQLAKIGGLY